MNYSIEILEAELQRLNVIANKFDYTSTNSIIDVSVLNDIADLEKAIIIIKNEMPINVIYIET